MKSVNKRKRERISRSTSNFDIFQTLSRTTTLVNHVYVHNIPLRAFPIFLFISMVHRMSLSSLPLLSPFFTRRAINPRSINQWPFLAGTFWQGNWELFGKRRWREPKNHEVRAFCHAAFSFNPYPKRAAASPGFIYREFTEFRPGPEFGRSIITPKFSSRNFLTSYKSHKRINRSTTDLITGWPPPLRITA